MSEDNNEVKIVDLLSMHVEDIIKVEEFIEETEREIKRIKSTRNKVMIFTLFTLIVLLLSPVVIWILGW